ncbi:MAG: tRNA(5-methylaminomethyl-2-thiouridylate) methyltransferase, partial [Desulfonatronovibrio sp.]
MTARYQRKYHGLALFSGGLDSILAVKMIQNQGLEVLGLHFISPFFGQPELIPEWEKNYGLPIMPVDISQDFVKMLLSGPSHGLGKIMNPCLDCKILMLKKARQLLQDFQAGFIISGEVSGQRPMSQRRDALNIIIRDAEVKRFLIRPLSAKLLPPTEAEETGLVNRSRLGSISGRGRKKQLEMAAKMNIHPLPTPAGGCLLTEMESSRRYLPLLRFFQNPAPD